MIKINNNIEKSYKVFLYCPIGEYIGRIKNYLAFLDIRRQIKEKNKEGYYLMFFENTRENGIRINIDKNGKLDQWPKNLFNETNDLLTELI